jgi:hypothetical protein
MKLNLPVWVIGDRCDKTRLHEGIEVFDMKSHERGVHERRKTCAFWADVVRHD